MVFYMLFMFFCFFVFLFCERMPRLDVQDDHEMLMQTFDNLVWDRFWVGFSPYLLFGWSNFTDFSLDFVHRTYKV